MNLPSASNNSNFEEKYETIKKPLQTLSYVLSIGCGLYFKTLLLWPIVGALIGWGIGNAFLKCPGKKIILPVFTIQMAQLLWFLLGTIYLTFHGSMQIWFNLIEILVFVAFLFWLFLKPSLPIFLLLIIYQVLRLLSHGNALIEIGNSLDLEGRAYILHIILDLMAITWIGSAIWIFWKRKNASPAQAHNC